MVEQNFFDVADHESCRPETDVKPIEKSCLNLSFCGHKCHEVLNVMIFFSFFVGISRLNLVGVNFVPSQPSHYHDYGIHVCVCGYVTGLEGS